MHLSHTTYHHQPSIIYDFFISSNAIFEITWYTYFNISAWLCTSFIYLTFWCIYSVWISIWVVYKSSYKNVYKIWLLFIGEHVNSYGCLFSGTSDCRPSEVKRRILGCSYFYLVTAVNPIMAKFKCNILLLHEWVLSAVPKTLLQLSRKLPGLRSIRRTITSFHPWCLSFSIFKLYYNSISWQNSNPIYRCSINSTRGPRSTLSSSRSLGNRFSPYQSPTLNKNDCKQENCPACNVTENDFSQVIHQ